MWQLRRAGVDDLDAIMVIENASFGGDAWQPAGMRSELANPQCYYVVAVRPETPDVVEAYAGLFAPRGADDSEIHTIAVAESARRQGLGRTMLLRMIDEARERGASRMFLEVRADNEGPRRLYERLGFERISRRAAYYPDGMDAIVMRLDIPAPEMALA
ncbi:ribosomal protein S18-alanine N-acetyltransferase [Marisediminicola senii]|uniref:ribosomal protein S18-alanine N-acetyltransferase n=1 Tax=Marisediminicola senii TaxID=2711233 RepID=UPI0019143F24|nr:ribosomal protein S18-alanine N-acetyltransferase [Marisediminicola senii]